MLCQLSENERKWKPYVYKNVITIYLMVIEVFLFGQKQQTR